MGGGKQTTETKIPEWLSAAAQQGLGRANNVASIGYTPYFGPDVAAMTPMQEAAATNINAGASAFGMNAPTGTGMPEAQTFAGGVRGYSSAPMYEAALSELKTRYPGQYNAIMGQFINPVSGAMPSWMQPAPTAQPASPIAQVPNRPDRSAAEMAALAPSQGSGNVLPSWLTSRLPGGVNTRNPASVVNQAVARAVQTKPSAPTQADRPVSRSSAASSKSYRGGR
jgi:hypothetical protein